MEVNDSICVGCKVCTIACPFGTINYNRDTGKVIKCDLCGGDPQCAEACPTGAITYVDATWTGLCAHEESAAERPRPAGLRPAPRCEKGCEAMGWQRKILRVDLTKGTAEAEPLNMDWAFEYLGERGLGTKYLMGEHGSQGRPARPRQRADLRHRPLTGTMASTSGRYAVITKGPLTGAIACSNSGGKFGAELKFAGYDLLVIHGRSPKPVYLHIVDDQVEILPADEIWGTTVWNTEEWIKTRHSNPLLKVASIGEAGEKGVRFACIVNDLHRAAGRSGVGAVMGSKNLKAVACHGTVGVRVKDPKEFMDAVKRANKLLAESQARQGADRERHQLHDRPDAGVRRPADPQLPGGPVRVDLEDQPGGHGGAEAERPPST